MPFNIIYEYLIRLAGLANSYAAFLSYVGLSICYVGIY